MRIVWGLGVFGLFIVIAVIVLLFRVLFKERNKEIRINRNAWKVWHAAELGPFFYEIEVGHNRVLVRKDSYQAALDRWYKDVEKGSIPTSQKIILVIHPAFSFYENFETRINMAQVGSWESIQKWKQEALRIVSGLSEEEFQEACYRSTIEYNLLANCLRATTCRSDQIFIPFSSTRQVSREEQRRLFEGQTLESAKEFLLGNLPKLK